MSERNDGGYAERGGVVGGAGGVAQPGGPNTSSGGTGGSSSNKSGAAKSDKSAGVSYSPAKKKSNVVSTYGELVPGARAPVVPGYGYAPRRDQTLQDIQEQNRIGNQNYANSQNTGSNGGITSSPLAPLPRRIINVKPPIPGVKPQPVRPITTTPPTEVVPGQPPGPPLPGNIGSYNPLSWGNSFSGIGWGNAPGLDSGVEPGGHIGGQLGSVGQADGQSTGSNFSGNLNTAAGQNKEAGRALGGPVGPGQYTVGENGPETLRLGPGSGGAVIPGNPADRQAGMMDPARRQAMVAALQGRFNGGGPGGGPGLTGMRPTGNAGPMAAPPPAPSPFTGAAPPRPAVSPRPASGWQG